MDDHVKIRWVYSFGDGKAEGQANMKNLLGGKGANLAEMSNLGLPVPPGFTITTEVCTYYYKNGQTYPSDLKDQVTEALAAVERSGERFYAAELHRLRGELLLAAGQEPAAVTGCFETALEIARHQRAPGLERRALRSLRKVRDVE